MSKDASVDLSQYKQIAAAVKEARGIRCLLIGGKMQWVTVTDGDAAQARVDHGWEIMHVGVGDLAEAVQEIANTLEGRERVGRGGQGLDEALRFQPHQCGPDQVGVRDRPGPVVPRHQGPADSRPKRRPSPPASMPPTASKALPGLASQILQLEGYGFGAEGDWKQACLGRQVHLTLKALGFKTAWSFMEPYIWDLVGGRTLGSHMLEPSPAIATGTPVVDVFQLTIGKSGFPARLIFDAEPGPALDLCLLDLGDHWEVLDQTAGDRPLRADPGPSDGCTV